MKHIPIIVFMVMTSFALEAQELPPSAEEQYPHSMHPVAAENTMFRRTLWFRMDLRQKQNEPLFAAGHELPRVIIDAVREGKITPFLTEDMNERMSRAEFEKRLIRPDSKSTEGENLDLFEDDGWESEEPEKAPDPNAEPFKISEMYTVEFKEDLVFDRIHSRMKNDIQAVSIMIPAAMNPKGIDIYLGTYSYKELVTQVFRDNPKAIWYNPANQAEHRTFEDAFDLWLFSARLVKFANPRDETIEDMSRYDNKASMIAAQEAWYKLIEFEAVLWSY